MQDDEPFVGVVETHVATEPGFYVGHDVTTAQYLNSTTGDAGIGFAFLVWDFDADVKDDEEVPTKQISLVMLDKSWLPRLMDELIAQVGCAELADALHEVIRNHEHKD